MDESEIILRKGFEDVTTRNVQASIHHGNDTRKLVRELELKISNLEGTIQMQNKVIEEMKKQIVGIQMLLCKGGTS